MINPAVRPAFELVPPSKKPNEFAVFIMDHVFLPVEQADGRVEKIVVHPQEWDTMKKNYGSEHLDLNVVPELLKAGIVASLFNAQVHVDESVQRGHMEVVYGDLKKKNVVCLMSKHLPGAKCGNMECLVDAVHDL